MVLCIFSSLISSQIEPLWCRLAIYDLNLNIRITEEICFEVPITSRMNSCTLGAIFYILKEYPLQHQYIVVKVCKILGGDPDLCITPYLQPERYFGTTERHKLLDRTNETTKRLGRYRQTFAWGATSLTLESRKRIVLYRQRSGLSDEQRLLQIPDAAKAALRYYSFPYQRIK